VNLVSKEQLGNYLKTFLKVYRSQIKRKYSAYFSEFPFYGALKVIGVLTDNKAYIIFTKDGNPSKTTFEVLDVTDIPELMRVKDALSQKDEDIFALLGIKTYIWDILPHEHSHRLRINRGAKYFEEKFALSLASESIAYHYRSSVEPEKDITRETKLGKGKYQPTIASKYNFVYNTIDERSLRTKVKEIIDKSEEGEEVLITGWIGSFAMPLLKSLAKKNVKFRIITHRPTSPKRGRSSSDEYDVFANTLTKKHSDNVRILGKLHARLLISEKEALISTADLTKDSHESKFEAGISTTDGLTILELRKFFDKMWESATKLRKK